MKPRTTIEQLSLFVLGALAVAQVVVTLSAANVVIVRKVALDLAWAVGIPTLASIPCYYFGFRSLRLNDRPAKWPVRVGAAMFLAAAMLYACMFAILNIYGS